MKRRIFVIAVVIIISVCSIINFSAIYKDYQREKREQQERIEAIHRSELIFIGIVTSSKGNLDGNIPEFDARYVIMQVALYNETVDRGVHEGEKILGYMEVQEEFNDYMSGRRTLEECRVINALYDFEKAEMCYAENPEQGIWYDYSYYIILVGDELGTGKERDYTVHTNSEVEEASKIAAKKWCDYMEGK